MTISEHLRAADYLNMDAVVEACVSVNNIANNLDLDSCFSTLKFAETLNNYALTQQIQLFLAKCFSCVIDIPEFLRCDRSFFFEILESDELVATEKFQHGETVNAFFVLPARQEELILRAAMRYVSFNPERKNDGLFLTRILSEGVRLALIPVDVLKSFQDEKLHAAWSDSATWADCVAVLDAAIALGARTRAAEEVDIGARPGALVLLQPENLTGGSSQGVEPEKTKY